jgi:hypothetical protein
MSQKNKKKIGNDSRWQHFCIFAFGLYGKIYALHHKDAVSAPLISTMASLPATMDFSKMEEEIIERWKEKEVFNFFFQISKQAIARTGR